MARLCARVTEQFDSGSYPERRRDRPYEASATPVGAMNVPWSSVGAKSGRDIWEMRAVMLVWSRLFYRRRGAFRASALERGGLLLRGSMAAALQEE